MVILEGRVVRKGFGKYVLKTEDMEVPLFTGNTWGVSTPSWNTFAGLSKTDKIVKLEGYYTTVALQEGFEAVKYIGE